MSCHGLQHSIHSSLKNEQEHATNLNMEKYAIPSITKAQSLYKMTEKQGSRTEGFSPKYSPRTLLLMITISMELTCQLRSKMHSFRA